MAKLLDHFLFLMIDKNIKGFMAFYRENFEQAIVLPKIRRTWLRKYRVGFGLMELKVYMLK